VQEEGQYVLILCNKIGQPIDSKYIEIEPEFLTMSENYVVAASHDCIFVWSYEVGLAAEASGKKSRRDERIFHADDAPSTAKEDWSKFRKAAVEAQDAVSCITVSDNLLLVGKESGLLQEYGLPGLSLGNRHFLECRPDSIALNCNSTKVSVVDIGGVMIM
jgi:WD repeat-containing protein 35